MNIVALILSLLISSDQKILEQGSSFVPVSDLDAYVYLLKPEKRAGFINDKVQVEKNLITILNINIVDDYINSKELINHEAFSHVDKIVDEMSVDLDDDFYLKLGIEQQSAYKSVKNFIAKKERFVRMRDFIKQNLSGGKIDLYLEEQFALNSGNLTIPEKRDLSMIKFDADTYNVEEVKATLIDLKHNDDFDSFSAMAIKHSSDSSVTLNQGHLKKFREADFKYPFAKPVFTKKSVGIIPNIFKYNNNYYVVRVNSITEAIKPKFEDHKSDFAERLLPELVDNKLQDIINTQAKNKVKVNPEVMAHVFERYKVLIEE